MSLSVFTIMLAAGLKKIDSIINLVTSWQTPLYGKIQNDRLSFSLLTKDHTICTLGLQTGNILYVQMAEYTVGEFNDLIFHAP